MKTFLVLGSCLLLLLACAPAATPEPTPTPAPLLPTSTPAPTPPPTSTPTPAPPPTSTPTPLPPTATPTPEPTLSAWTYWLEPELEPVLVEELAGAEVDLVVLDFIPSLTDHVDYPMADTVAQLQQADRPKLVLAYLNIGQAERSRTYWQPYWTPADTWWIIEQVAVDRVDNFPVGYWNEEYRDIWLGEEGYVRSLLAAGFDGIYLDGLQAAADGAVVAFAGEDGADPAQEMLWLVGDIGELARSEQPDFLIIGHNLAELPDPALRDGLLEIVDGLGQERLWFELAPEAAADCPIPATRAEVDTVAYREKLAGPCQALYEAYPAGPLHRSREEVLAALEMAQAAGKLVLTVDYALEPENVAQVEQAARVLGFVPLVTNQPLGRYEEYVEPVVVAAEPEATAEETGPPPVVLPAAPTPLPPALAEVDDFLYQLQNVNLEAVGQTAYDLVVMDSLNDDGIPYSRAQVEALRNSPGGSKIVLAYMSIGEAESYRSYWDPGWDADYNGLPDEDAPAWLDVANPAWPGNYKVRYWDSAWQDIIMAYTDRLLNAGFDGVYLDIIDAYVYYAEERETAAQDMADFVAAIAAHARQVDPDFYVFPQNAPQLAVLVPEYLDSVSGIGHEEVYYGYGGDDQPTPPEITATWESYLELFKQSGKLVLTIEYASDPAHIDEAYARAQARGYVPFVSVRNVDQLVINPGHEPD